MSNYLEESNKVISDSKEFLSKNKEKYDVFSMVIDQMINLTDDSYPEIVQLINLHKDVIFKDHQNALLFFKNIILSARCNFKHLETQLNIILEFSEEFRKCKVTDSEIISPGIYYNAIFYLFSKNFFTIESITQISITNPYIFVFFLPEIEEYDPDYIQMREKNLFDENSDQKLKQLYEFVKQNPDKHKQYRESNYHPSLLHKSIRENNIQLFQELFSKNNYDINHRIEFSFYERVSMLNSSQSFAGIAAVYGCSDIFKFLWMQSQFNPEKSLLHYAYFGGNFDIIHLCEANFSEEFVSRQPIMTHNYALLDYYLEKYDNLIEDDKINKVLKKFVLKLNEDEEEDAEEIKLYQKLSYDSLIICLNSFNYVVLKKCLPKITFLTKFFEFKNANFLTDLSYLLITGSLFDIDLFEFLLSQKCIDSMNTPFFYNLLILMINRKANDAFKIIYSKLENIDLMEIFMKCVMVNSDLAVFLLDQQLEEKKLNKEGDDPFYRYIKNGINVEHLFYSINYYNEDVVVKMIELYEILKKENINQFAKTLKNAISEKMIISLINKLSAILSPDFINLLTKNLNMKHS